MRFVYDGLLFLHFVGLAMAVGTTFATLRLASATRDLEATERSKFMLTAFALGKNGSIGLVLLLVSGLVMFFIQGPAVVMSMGHGAFHAKLTLVVVLSGLFGYMQVLTKKVKRDNGGPNLPMLARVRFAMLVVGLATIACAVLAFH
jgi:uncharacterized membrane protein